MGIRGYRLDCIVKQIGSKTFLRGRRLIKQTEGPWNWMANLRECLSEQVRQKLSDDQMRSNQLLAYLSLNCLFNGLVSCSWYCFVQFHPENPISLEFNGPSDGHTPLYRYENASNQALFLLDTARFFGVSNPRYSNGDSKAEEIGRKEWSKGKWRHLQNCTPKRQVSRKEWISYDNIT